jgi:hypothetical protein
MSHRIGDGGGRPPIDPKNLTPVPHTPGLDTETGVKEFRKAAHNVDARVVDQFVAKGATLEKQLQAITGKLKFSSQELAAIATAFAAVLAKYPNADRRKRAQLFARTLLRKQKPFDRLFADADESELEEMFNLLGDQLEGSPRFAQLVDEVTEGAKKINLR